MGADEFGDFQDSFWRFLFLFLGEAYVFLFAVDFALVGIKVFFSWGFAEFGLGTGEGGACASGDLHVLDDVLVAFSFLFF